MHSAYKPFNRYMLFKYFLSFLDCLFTFLTAFCSINVLNFDEIQFTFFKSLVLLLSYLRHHFPRSQRFIPMLSCKRFTVQLLHVGSGSILRYFLCML